MNIEICGDKATMITGKGGILECTEEIPIKEAWNLICEAFRQEVSPYLKKDNNTDKESNYDNDSEKI